MLVKNKIALCIFLGHFEYFWLVIDNKENYG
jgi:hypothetical protein